MSDLKTAFAFVLVALGLAAPAVAQVIPFDSDGCVPGYTAEGIFVDESGNEIPSDGYVATADGKVLDAAGRQVFLRRECLGALQATEAGLGGSGLSVIVVGLGVLILGAGGSTNGTN